MASKITYLTDKEFYIGVSKKLNISPEKVKEYWEQGFLEFIIHEVYYKGKCRVPFIGNFYTKRMKEQMSVQHDPKGNLVTYRVPERDVPFFTASDHFINDINMQGVTKQFRKRLKNQKLSKRDYLREVRAQKLESYGSISSVRIENSRKDFKKMIDDKKNG